MFGDYLADLNNGQHLISGEQPCHAGSENTDRGVLLLTLAAKTDGIKSAAVPLSEHLDKSGYPSQDGAVTIIAQFLAT